MSVTRMRSGLPKLANAAASFVGSTKIVLPFHCRTKVACSMA